MGAKVGTIDYDLPAGATRTLHLALTDQQRRDGGLITLTDSAAM
jgi:hypothetical protein